MKVSRSRQNGQSDLFQDNLQLEDGSSFSKPGVSKLAMPKLVTCRDFFPIARAGVGVVSA